ncbi:twin-arginine translocation signal domain-containing protein [Candidatus Gottesmanbacteria bacterium]|nr:twin-arginine translocation signal domain-containing protein [Candidatus Gottesmanbacteria bacterium]
MGFNLQELPNTSVAGSLFPSDSGLHSLAEELFQPIIDAVKSRAPDDLFNFAGGAGKERGVGKSPDVFTKAWYVSQLDLALQREPLLAWTALGITREKLVSFPSDSQDLSFLFPVLGIKLTTGTQMTRRQFLKLAGLGTAAGVLAACNSSPKPPEQKPLSLKDEILGFTWNDFDNPEKRSKFIDDLAKEYLTITKSTLLSKKEMQENVTFCATTSEYITAVQRLDPERTPDTTDWGYTNFKTGKVLINIESIKRQSTQAGGPTQVAGLALLDGLWHEWGHLDTVKNSQGTLLNKQEFQLQRPDGVKEDFGSYRGGEVFTDNYYGFAWFNEVLLETITIRRIIDHFGFESIISAGDYYENGVDVFSQVTQFAGISTDELYRFYSTSDFEGLLRKLGKALPEKDEYSIPDHDLEKGLILAIGIHQSNGELIKATGVCTLYPEGFTALPKLCR